MDKIFTKTRLKVFFVLTLLIGVLIGGYYLYGYYKNHFVEPYFVFVRFNPSVTQEEALVMLEKYKPGISTRTPVSYDPENPTNYDLADVASYESFGRINIQFKVSGLYRSKYIHNALVQEPQVQFPKYTEEIDFLEKTLAYFFN